MRESHLVYHPRNYYELCEKSKGTNREDSRGYFSGEKKVLRISVPYSSQTAKMNAFRCTLRRRSSFYPRDRDDSNNLSQRLCQKKKKKEKQRKKETSINLQTPRQRPRFVAFPPHFRLATPDKPRPNRERGREKYYTCIRSIFTISTEGGARYFYIRRKSKEMVYI